MKKALKEVLDSFQGVDGDETLLQKEMQIKQKI